MMSDIDLAEAFLVKLFYVGGIKIGGGSSLYFKNKAFRVDLRDGRCLQEKRDSGEAISILHCWLLEHLRDGGKNFVCLSDVVKFAKPAVKVTVQSNPVKKGIDVPIVTTGTSDLDVLIKAYKLLKEKSK